MAQSGQTPLQYLLEVMREKENPQDIRVDAAAKAAPYVHPKLSSVNVRGAIGTYDLSGLSNDQLKALEDLLIHVVERADAGVIEGSYVVDE